MTNKRIDMSNDLCFYVMKPSYFGLAINKKEKGNQKLEKSGILGVDIGGVIIDKANDNTDTSFFGKNYPDTTATLGVFDALRRLKAERYKDVFLVSKCGPNTQEKTIRWLAYHDFYELIGIGSDHVRFCRKRNEKAPVCLELGITDFVDDRLEVLSYFGPGVTTRYLFQSNPKEVQRFEAHLGGVIRVESWDEIVRRELPLV